MTHSHIHSHNGPVVGNKVIFNETGSTDVLQYKEVEFPMPVEGEVRIRMEAIGLNYIDTYFRSGVYPTQFPAAMGTEGAGVIESVGAGEKAFSVGDRVCFAIGRFGTYADYYISPSENLIKIPDHVSFEQAAAVTLKGLTAQFLVKQLKRLREGDIVVVWAAAGGVGLILLQWLKAMKVKVIAITSSKEKMDLAHKFGAWKTIDHKTEDVVAKVLEYTDGKKASVVYDSVGKATFEKSLDMLERHGLMVSYGNASGPVTDVNIGILNQKGSLFLTRPSLHGYAYTHALLTNMAHDLFGLISSGDIKVNINQRYSLSNVAQAHKDLESGKTTGSSIIIPDALARQFYKDLQIN